MTGVNKSAYAQPPDTRTRWWWPVMGSAVVLGILGAFLVLAFLAVTGQGGHRFTLSNANLWMDTDGRLS
jgi:hypothetical protein